MNKQAANEKYNKYKSTDPFPDIPPALLNSADIEDYVVATGMIDPFDRDKLKSASYEGVIGGACRYWDDEGKLVDVYLVDEYQSFTLKPNSIAFVEISPKFKLPDYIAMRFNLKIKHVYRGLLLGTGPLVDPGFKGKIYIPLHNLTSNAYTLEYGEGLIWIEFTKVSNNVRWMSDEGLSRVGNYKPFNNQKVNKGIHYYLNQANGGRPIKSSIPDVIVESTKLVKKAERKTTILAGFSILGAIAVICSIFVLIYNSLAIQRDYIDKSEGMTDEIVLKLDGVDEIHANLTKEVERLSEELIELKSKLEKPVQDDN